MRNISALFPNRTAALLMLIVPIFIGLSITVLGMFAGILWAVLLCSGLFILLLSYSQKDHSGTIFITIFLLFYLLWLIKKTTDFSLVGLWQLSLVFFIFGIARFYQFLRVSPIIQFSLTIFVAFLGVALLSTLYVKTPFWSASYQLLSDLKPIFLIIAGFAITWKDATEKAYWRIVEWFWLPALIFIAVEWAAPEFYFSVFKGDPSADPSGIVPSRAVGPFIYPSFLAASAAMYALLIFSKLQMTQSNTAILQSKNKQTLYDWLKVLAYLVIIGCALQRQELATVSLGLLLIFILAKPEYAIKRSIMSLIILLVTTGIFWLIFSKNIMYEIPQWGFGTIREIEHPRAQIYEGAFVLAKEYYPLGSGLGTYGGAGADKFNYTLYYHLGFMRYWWFGRENFLMDTYWPNSIAEAGFWGAGLLFLSYCLFFAHAVFKSIRSIGKAAMYWRFCAAGMLYLILLSLTSPAFQDPMLSFLPLLAFGMAYQYEQQK
jgi:hypothetical protein